MPNNSQRSRNNSRGSGNNVIQATFVGEPQIIIGETIITEDEKKEQIKKLNEKIENLNEKLTNMKKEDEKKENCILKYKSEVKKLKDKNNELNIISEKHNRLRDSVIKMKNSVDIMKNENIDLNNENAYLVKRYRTREVILNKESMKACDLNETVLRRRLHRQRALEKENEDLKKTIIDIKNKWADEVDILENQNIFLTSK